MKRLRVLLADEHRMVREALRLLLESRAGIEGIEVVAEVGNGCAAVNEAERLQPDVVVMEARLPLLDSAQAACRIKVCAPSTKLLVLSALGGRRHLCAMLTSGATGYVLKSSSSAEMLWALRNVARGGLYLDSQFPPDVVRGLNLVTKRDGTATISGLEWRDAATEAVRAVGSYGSRMDQTEMCLLWYVSQGYGMKETAHRLCLSIKTIEMYKARAMQKLNLSSRADIMRYAIHNGWFDKVDTGHNTGQSNDTV